MSHKATGPVYRCTVCDRCEKPKQDCIWVQVTAWNDSEWCVCGDCRRRAREAGIALTNIDVDFPSVAA